MARVTTTRPIGGDAPVTALRGVGERRAQLLARLGVHTVGELLALQPRRVERRGPQVEIGELAAHLGSPVHVRGRVLGVRVQRQSGRSIVRVGIESLTGAGRTEAVYFNQPYLRDHFPAGRELHLYGRVVKAPGLALAAPRLVRPDDPLPGALELVYPATARLGQPLLQSIVLRALELVGPTLMEPIAAEDLARLELPPLPEALVHTHRPSSLATLRQGLDRLRLESALEVQAELAERRRARESGAAPRLTCDAATRAAIEAALPFAPTAAQRRVFDELAADLARSAPMRRLLQGDVGSGKTVCASFAVVLAARHGVQAALLAPTEVLAEQHFATERGRLAKLGVESALLTGSQRADTRRKIVQRLADGSLACVFGTHALLSPNVRFSRLGLAIVDEQHRFGVLQREQLFAKGRDVHQLLMTATPIPRTLASALWADLDTSVLDEKPPGRSPPRTHVLARPSLPRIERHLFMRLEAGERGLWIAPRIESSAAGRGAVEVGEALAASHFGRFGVEVVHGDVPLAERARRIERFRSGEARLLVGTTMLEVGLDVPEATVVVVEGAERLGAAQLHQVRGRVGRGGGDSWCFFVASDDAVPRLAWLEEVHDGFVVAERDLVERGMGDFFGERQVGVNTEGLGDGEPDLRLWLAARDLLARDPALRAIYAARSASRR